MVLGETLCLQKTLEKVYRETSSQFPYSQSVDLHFTIIRMNSKLSFFCRCSMDLSMERRFWKQIIFPFLGSALNMSIKENITKTGRPK